MLLARLIKRILYFFLKNVIVLTFKILGPPRVLNFHRRLNVDILKAFGAKIGDNNVRKDMLKKNMIWQSRRDA